MAHELASVRSNIRYDVKGGEATPKMVPSVELVLLAFHPEYSYGKDGKITKKHGLAEMRFEVGPDGFDKIIAELQATRQTLLAFQQAGHLFNQIIETSIVKG